MAALAAPPSRGFSRDSRATSESKSRSKIEVIRREFAARVGGLEPPELDPEHQRPGGAEVHVSLAREVLEPAVRVAQLVRQVAVVGMGEATAAADHHFAPGPDVELTP